MPVTTSLDNDQPRTPPTPPPNARRVADIVEVDLASAATFGRGVPHAAFDELRRHGGIAWHDEPPVAGMLGDNPLLQFVDSPGFWVVTATTSSARSTATRSSSRPSWAARSCRRSTEEASRCSAR